MKQIPICALVTFAAVTVLGAAHVNESTSDLGTSLVTVDIHPL